MTGLVALVVGLFLVVPLPAEFLRAGGVELPFPVGLVAGNLIATGPTAAAGLTVSWIS